MPRPRKNVRNTHQTCIKCGEHKSIRCFECPTSIYQYRKVCNTCHAKSAKRTLERNQRTYAASVRLTEKAEQLFIKQTERLVKRLTRTNRNSIKRLEIEQAIKRTSRGQTALKQRYAIQERYERAAQTIIHAYKNKQPIPLLEDLV